MGNPEQQAREGIVRPGETICDPARGSGGFLFTAHGQHIKSLLKQNGRAAVAASPT